MTFTQAISSGFGKYATFSGRASRSQFWFWTLFTILVSSVSYTLDFAVFGVDLDALFSPIGDIANLVLLVPSLAIAARRLHDMDRTGWWQLLLLTGIGIFVLLVWYCLKGTDGPNRFGPDPLDYR